MPSARTTSTEVSTALGCLDLPSIEWAVLRRPEVAGVSATDWEQIDQELADPKGCAVASSAFDNGRAFLAHREGLRSRSPVVVEWTGGRKPPGDQVIPADLRIDHVYLVSCKYLSNIVLNASPWRLFDGLLRPGAAPDRRDWFDEVAPSEHRSFASISARALGLEGVRVEDGLGPSDRQALKRAFGRHARLDGDVAAAYRALCRAVSERSAEHWRTALEQRGLSTAELLLWRMLRLASATYFVLGVGPGNTPLRLRVMTPWDWRQRFDLLGFDIEPAGAGQPQVTWAATVRDREAGAEQVVHGHVEVRWSHGRFGGPPEAKVYLDTPHADVPGYVPLT